MITENYSSISFFSFGWYISNFLVLLVQDYPYFHVNACFASLALLPYWYGHDSMILLQLVCYAHWCWNTRIMLPNCSIFWDETLILLSFKLNFGFPESVTTYFHLLADCTIFLFLELLHSSISSSNLLIDFADSWNWCIERAKWGNALQGAHINWTNQHWQAGVVVRSFCSAHRPKMQCGKQWNLDTQF